MSAAVTVSQRSCHWVESDLRATDFYIENLETILCTLAKIDWLQFELYVKMQSVLWVPDYWAWVIS